METMTHGPRPPVLNYDTPKRRRLPTGVVVAIFLGAVAAGLLVVFGGWFLSSSGSGPAVMAPPTPKVWGGTTVTGAPVGFADDLVVPDNIGLSAAQTAATALLDDLIARKFDGDPELGVLANKLSEYHGWNVYKQTGGEKQWVFTGYFHSINGWADFALTMVKQGDGSWKMATMSGPTRKP
jgi:hypothetical protein